MNTKENPFTVYPAIDLRGGRCVRLKQGDFGRSKEYDADPVERTREWERQGAAAIHVVDLDGARAGRPVQLDLIGRMADAVNVPLQVGGGIRTIGDQSGLFRFYFTNKFKVTLIGISFYIKFGGDNFL